MTPAPSPPQTAKLQTTIFLSSSDVYGTNLPSCFSQAQTGLAAPQQCLDLIRLRQYASGRVRNIEEKRSHSLDSTVPRTKGDAEAGEVIKKING